ncbi:MAG: hypothetical protein WBD99_14305 [Thermodesulfobacteriota bacterium]
MTSKNRSFIIMVFIFFGCAASPQSLYDSIESVASNSVANKFSEAIKFGEAEEIVPNEIVEFELGTGNPVIELGNGHRYRTFYRLFEFTGSAGSMVSFRIKTSCKCISVLRETIVYPVAYILDYNGNVLRSDPREWERKHDFILTGLSYEGLWGAKIPEDGEYFLLVAADNSFVGVVLGINYPLILPDSPETYILSSPSGKVKVEMSAN